MIEIESRCCRCFIKLIRSLQLSYIETAAHDMSNFKLSVFSLKYTMYTIHDENCT